MFTNEFEYDETVITIMDEEANFDDIKIIFSDETVHIIQYNSDSNIDIPNVICMSHQMFKEIQYSLLSSEGMYKLDH